MCRPCPSSTVRFTLAWFFSIAAGCNSDLVSSSRPDSAGGKVDLALPGATPDLAGAIDQGSSDLAQEDLVASMDLVMVDAPEVDQAQAGPFPELGGIWLVGWSGGLEHYTWIRFDARNPGGGTADFLQPMGNMAWIAFWPGCDGAGRWTLAARPRTVVLEFPARCNLANLVLTWKSIQPPMGGWPQNAILEATFENSPPAPPGGWKFPNQQCDANFTRCMLP